MRELCRQQGLELIEWYAMRDHIHMLLMTPLKFSVANTFGFLKGKSAIRIFREYLQVKRNFTGRHFWVRGYCVSTVGLDEQMIREYIRNQEREEKRQEQMQLAGLPPLGAFIIPSALRVVFDFPADVAVWRGFGFGKICIAFALFSISLFAMTQSTRQFSSHVGSNRPLPLQQHLSHRLSYGVEYFVYTVIYSGAFLNDHFFVA